MTFDEDEIAEITLSTTEGPITVPCYRVGPFAIHPMLADDLPLRPDPNNGYGISWVENGWRLSYEGRVFKGASYAIVFARCLLEATSDWSRWFITEDPAPDLVQIFKGLQWECDTRGELMPVAIYPRQPQREFS